jgi:hypothetical protein
MVKSMLSGVLSSNKRVHNLTIFHGSLVAEVTLPSTEPASVPHPTSQSYVSKVEYGKALEIQVILRNKLLMFFSEQLRVKCCDMRRALCFWPTDRESIFQSLHSEANYGV